MSENNEKKRRRFFRENFTEKINGDANRLLRVEIYRLARVRDIIGLFLIVAIGVIITLSVLLYRHW